MPRDRAACEVRLSPTLCLAPLEGVTNRLFRSIYARHFQGFDAAVAPFILSIRTDRMKEHHFRDLNPRDDANLPLIPQLLSNDAESFIETARVLADLGYTEVNWNLGCPYAKVANKERGAGLLPHPERIEHILAAVCPRVGDLGMGLSVKLRLGLADPEEILRLTPVLNAAPLARVIIHPRLGVQLYAGKVDLDGFGAALAASTHPVMYNGDIRDIGTYRALAARFPQVNGWMIGRGALADPFLAARIKGLNTGTAGQDSPQHRLAELRAFHDDLYAGYREVLSGPAHVLDKMKEVWTYLGPSFTRSGYGLSRIAKARNLAAYDCAVGMVFSAARRAATA